MSGLQALPEQQVQVRLGRRLQALPEQQVQVRLGRRLPEPLVQPGVW